MWWLLIAIPIAASIAVGVMFGFQKVGLFLFSLALSAASLPLCALIGYIGLGFVALVICLFWHKDLIWASKVASAGAVIGSILSLVGSICLIRFMLVDPPVGAGGGSYGPAEWSTEKETLWELKKLNENLEKGKK